MVTIGEAQKYNLCLKCEMKFSDDKSRWEHEKKEKHTFQDIIEGA